MTLIFLCFLLLFSFEESILYFTGASDISEVSETDMEHFRTLQRHPLHINFSSAAALTSSGLFSSYQAASLVDYRMRCGDVLSVTELSVVDGFTPTIATHMAEFLDFAPTGSGVEVTRSVSNSRLDGEVSAGFAAKAAEGKGYARWMGKAAATYGGWGASVAVRSPWALPLAAPENIGATATYEGKRWLSLVVVGNFNARFGQGLLQWSGSDFKSFTTPQSLMKRPMSISPYKSYSDGSMMGAALRIDAGRLSISPFADLKERKYGTNVAWNHNYGQFGVTALFFDRHLFLSADFQQTVKGAVLYGEITSLKSGLLGVRMPLGAVDAGVRLLYSNDEHAIACAASFLSLNRRNGVDAACNFSYSDKAMNVKSQVTYSANVDSLWFFRTKAAATLKPVVRKYELRSDVSLRPGLWEFAVRLHGLHCIDWAVLSYAECGFKPSSLSAYMQVGAFRVDNWDDRIYVYRMDAPGNFNVPAMYGRGWWMAAYLCWKLMPCRLYLRADYTSYPWARPDDRHRRPSAGASLSASFDLGYLRKTKKTAATIQAKAAM